MLKSLASVVFSIVRQLMPSYEVKINFSNITRGCFPHAQISIFTTYKGNNIIA